MTKQRRKVSVTKTSPNGGTTFLAKIRATVTAMKNLKTSAVQILMSILGCRGTFIIQTEKLAPRRRTDSSHLPTTLEMQNERACRCTGRRSQGNYASCSGHKNKSNQASSNKIQKLIRTVHSSDSRATLSTRQAADQASLTTTTLARTGNDSL